jgi:flavin-dependent dehydrogenase
VGAGPAGAAAAATAHAAGLEVVLYDAGPPARMRPGESLPPGVAHLVDEIFGAGSFRPGDHLPAYANRSSWGSEDTETADFVFNPFGHGWHLDRSAFDAALLAAAQGMGVRVLQERLARAPAAGFVIDATGRSARIARSLGARRRRADRLVAAFRTESGDAGSATTVRAAEDGWSYRAPLPGGGSIIAFLTDADLMPRLPGQVTDASTSWLDRRCGPRWLATGDAAVAFDPLSSQGIATALVMGREAGRAAAGLVSIEEYDARYRSLLDEHLALRAAYYGLERRWPDAEFWRRRPNPKGNSTVVDGGGSVMVTGSFPAG